MKVPVHFILLDPRKNVFEVYKEMAGEEEFDYEIFQRAQQVAEDSRKVGSIIGKDSRCQVFRYKDGKICFPVRGFEPGENSTWLVDLEDRGRVFIARPICELVEIEDSDLDYRHQMLGESLPDGVYSIPGRHWGGGQDIRYFRRKE